MMKTLFALSAVTALTVGFVHISPASAATPAMCYGLFPGAKGKACCDRSYSATPEGAMNRGARMTQLTTCVASNSEKRSKTSSRE